MGWFTFNTLQPFLLTARFCVCSLVVLAVFVTQGCGWIKPDPIDPFDHLKRVEEDRLALYAEQEPLSAPLTLEMAIARALKYNFDHRLAIMEAIFHDEQLTAATLAMLPKLVANAGYTDRDNEAASSSISYKTRKETLEPSVSGEKERLTADLTLTWNILDFGLSYYQAKQQADRYLIMQERRRRIVNNLVKEVIGAYWKAVTAERLLPEVNKALKEAQSALKSYDKIAKEGLAQPLESLEQKRDLMSIVNQLTRLKDDLTISRIKLAALINVPFEHSFKIASLEPYMLKPPPLNVPLEELENKGLASRPDLREEAYQERIDKAEIKKEIVRMIPGVSIFAGFNFDSNKFLVNQHWNEAGARATMNLFNLVSGTTQYKAAKTKVEVTRTRRLAQTVAALVQINLSYHQYRQALEDYRYSKEVNKIEKQIFAIAQTELDAEAQSKLENIRRSVSSVRSQIELDRSLSDLYLFWGNMYFSLGGDIVPLDFEDGELSFMAETIREKLERWWQGELPFDEYEGAPPAERR